MALSNKNYINIQAWMVKELNLTGNDLICYALIYGFSQDGKSEFNGSLSYIAEWINTSRQTARLIVKRLVDNGVIEKRDTVINGVKFCRYVATNTGCGDFHHTVMNNNTGCGENRHGGVVEIATNNILDNINNNTKSTNVDYSVSTREETDLFEVESNNDPLPSEVFGFTAKGLDVTKKTIERTDKLFTQLTFPFESEDFKRLFYVLMTQPKWRVKTKTLTAMQANLNEIAQFEEEFAKSLIQQSISKGWASLVYESTPKQYLQWLREKTGATNQYQQNNSQQYKTKQYFANDEHREIYERYLTETFD
jgi:DNA-binding Lrp family transcriptional regulator